MSAYSHQHQNKEPKPRVVMVSKLIADFNRKLVPKHEVAESLNMHHDQELYGAFAERFAEEQHHPNLVKRFGFAMEFKEEDFTRSF